MFGKGGKKGGGKRKNPTVNGKVLQCFDCGSEDHLRANCPKSKPGPGQKGCSTRVPTGPSVGAQLGRAYMSSDMPTTSNFQF
eukprot:12345230-Karenia_brevis.AAC.1